MRFKKGITPSDRALMACEFCDAAQNTTSLEINIAFRAMQATICTVAAISIDQTAGVISPTMAHAMIIVAGSIIILGFAAAEGIIVFRPTWFGLKDTYVPLDP